MNMSSSTRYELREVLLTVFGLLCILASIVWYRATLIGNVAVFLVLPSLLLGLFGIVRWPKRAGDLYGEGAGLRRITGFFAHTVALGGIYSALLLGLNRAWLRDDLRQLRCPIVAKSSQIGERGKREKRRPVVTVEIGGQQKNLVFDHEEQARLDTARAIEVDIRTGLLGFPVILTRKY